MERFRSSILIVTVAAAVCLSTTLFSDQAMAACDTEYRDTRIQPDASLMFVDAVVVRPVSLLASVAGTAVWVVSLPFTLLGDNTSEAGEVLVTNPWCYTFSRPLGHMEKAPR